MHKILFVFIAFEVLVLLACIISNTIFSLDFDIVNFSLVQSLFTFCFFGIDKVLSVNRNNSFPDSLLLMMSLFLGAPGAVFAMIVFNHIKLEKHFLQLIVASVVINLFILMYFWNQIEFEKVRALNRLWFEWPKFRKHKKIYHVDTAEHKKTVEKKIENLIND